ncbi:hypothetical protein B1757_12340 [Acidithiobacillus marinus]|uniref:TubC N-terminal docking domain-containing protein n=1 Tax=Acidithiobacillus marinus TaxID=187490 RepID=A0A2I1DJL7_9PROT|nr:hypothetical protein [Acidithiobacillus marinus]PKY10063.1 hypothetical protein B1757_12340 [Acidithiobacillus marinus]
MKPAQIVVDIVDAGGAVWVEAGHLKAKRIPAHLIPHIRENKASLLALLSPQPFVAPLPSEQCADDYAMAERLAIQAESMDYTTAPAPMQHSAAMAPQRVSCGQCCRFQPGPQPLSIGVCLATSHGLPPEGGSGYKAAYPMAVRSCPEYAGVAS